MNRLDVYDAVLRFLQFKVDIGHEIEIYDESDIEDFMKEFDEWLQQTY